MAVTRCTQKVAAISDCIINRADAIAIFCGVCFVVNTMKQ